MKKFRAKILVYTKENIKNPQGETLARLLSNLDLESVSNPSVGKYYALDISGENSDLAKEKAEKIATEVLSNPLVEDFEIVEMVEVVED